mgnify:CR=1 FL=1|jgi:hypothetical protein
MKLTNQQINLIQNTIPKGSILLLIIVGPVLFYVVTLIQVVLNWDYKRIKTSATSS